MKKKFTFMVVLCLLLVVSLMGTVAFATSTTAKVAFTEGTPEFGDADLDGLHNMNIDFGTHTLPIGPQTYTAVDHDHTLRVIDPRSAGTAGKWNVTVALSAFASADLVTPSAFNATITLATPTVTTGLSAPGTLTITSGAAAQIAVTAAEGLSKANYDTTWARENIALSFDAAAAAAITKSDVYTAELTWTLSII